MEYKSVQERVTNRFNSEQVMILALESTTRKGEVSERGNRRVLALKFHGEFDTLIRRSIEKDVHGPEGIAIIMCGNHRQSKVAPEQCGRTRYQLIG